ncbi:glycosyltransferase family 1 protein [Pseudogemmatithrix spongiicola]|uniref:Glycosyltransferase family 1 protein n=1 Tax=Pseudogemmatithrix spongiicola TaxID=3062599 RepID=A0AA49K0V5_9BACT|nr:glycosyltransferase family 1 protein [Gemmatimonadaceae bacterium 'strain 138']WKW15383.1 glycosyltransferase family 1 protein [Gemmatimonadaceae bacterium 'strain 318']
MSRGPSVLYDGIVFDLQAMGGISVLFREIITRCPPGSFRFLGYGASPPAFVPTAAFERRRPRLLERYRDVPVEGRVPLFHSTYYRVPASRRTPCVTTVHDFVYERFVGGLRTAVHARQKRAAILRADAIICVSESTRQDLAHYVGHRAAERAAVVHNGVADGFRPSVDAVVQPQVLFVGQRGGYKNFVGAVQALEALPDLALRCVGGGPFTAAEQALVDRCLPGRARWLGHLSDEQLNSEYNSALCLLYPSCFEGFGIPVLEAMRAGCPVVAVRAGGVPEAAGDAALLTERGDPDELRAAVASLFDARRRSELVARGLVQAARFGWERSYHGTRAVYESLLGRPFAAASAP